MNTFKTFMLLTIMTLFFVWVGGFLGGRTGMTFALIFAAIMNLSAYWFSDKVILKMYKAREVTEAEVPELYSIVRRLTQKAAMPMPKVYIIDADQPNAFATGRNPKHAAVAVTNSIMRLLSPEELEGVIGHELTHIRHRDILVSSVAATIAGAITFLAQMAQWAFIFGGFGRGSNDEGGNPFVALLMMIVAPIAAMIVQMAISRSREYAADAGGARITGNPRYLASALRKLDTASGKIPMKATPATSHLFIVNPLSGKKVAKLFSTHPPVEERIARLEAMSL
ncbi:MAG TPA: zinc metalloprotease HtpX [Nitrospirae bacterium]|nr:zinc metalloprotease HtpX [Nitrospirota bacterium]